MGHRVLLVDADPQCNLSSVFLGEKFDAYYDDPKTCNNNIMDGVRPAFAGTPDPIRAIDCPNHDRPPRRPYCAAPPAPRAPQARPCPPPPRHSDAAPR